MACLLAATVHAAPAMHMGLGANPSPPRASSCPAMRSCPGPGSGATPLVIYNRLPKCGSSTMLELLAFHANRTGGHRVVNSRNYGTRLSARSSGGIELKSR